MDDSETVKKFYDGQYDESVRESRTPLEFIRSRIIISRYLTPKMTIADIAGGVGAYSFWLAGLGHTVHLLDLSQKHIDYAVKRGSETNRLASCVCGDARDLPYENESMDMVLLMGALYHLQDINDRRKCLFEARRVLKNEGVIICTAIGRYAALIGNYKWGNIDENNMRLVDESVKTGNYSNPPWFTVSYYHTPNEIFNEASEFFSDVKLIAVEGFANAVNTDDYLSDEYKKLQLLRHIEMTESVPELMGVSKNIMAVGYKK